MARYKILFASILTASAITFPMASFSQSNTDDVCGAAPTAPAIIDGASSEMAALVENSKAVNGFIAEADSYLDCREGYVKDMSNDLSKSERKDISDSIKSLTDERNKIGDLFNAEVANFKEANPQ